MSASLLPSSVPVAAPKAAADAVSALGGRLKWTLSASVRSSYATHLQTVKEGEDLLPWAKVGLVSLGALIAQTKKYLWLRG